jgi:uroporphyrinogen III methyltransferase/synthase
VTHRGLASSVTVVTGRVGATTGPADIDWEALAKVEGTLVVLMGMRTRGEIADALQRGGKDPDTAVAVIEQGTTPAQRTIRTTLARLRDVELGSPAVIVIGPVAALGDAIWSGGAGPLGGRTVVVTRSGPRAYELVDALWHVGARVVELPLTAQIGPADDGASLRAAVAELETYDWVVFTSANAVERMMAELRDARQFGPARVAAVGPATADALRRAGIEPDLVPAEHRAQGLLDEFPACEGAQAGRVLFPSADLAPSTVPDGLGQKGWEVTRIEAYRTVASADAEPGLLAEAAAADAVTFAASSAVRAYLALRTPEGEPLAVPPVVVCLGPSTADTARAAGLNGVLEAEGATTLGTVAVLIDRLGEGPSGGS